MTSPVEPADWRDPIAAPLSVSYPALRCSPSRLPLARNQDHEDAQNKNDSDSDGEKHEKARADISSITRKQCQYKNCNPRR